MKRMVPLLGSVFLVPSLSCVPPPENSGDCPLDDFQRGLIAEVITELLEDALWVTEMTHDLEQGSSLSLIGVNQAYRTTAFLVGECTEPQEFDPFCETAALPPTEEQEPFWQTRDRCGQLACESAGIRLPRVTGIVFETNEETYDYFLDVLPVQFMSGHLFCFAEGFTPHTLFFRRGKRFLVRQLTEEETQHFCRLANIPLPGWW